MPYFDAQESVFCTYEERDASRLADLGLSLHVLLTGHAHKTGQPTPNLAMIEEWCNDGSLAPRVHEAAKGFPDWALGHHYRESLAAYAHRRDQDRERGKRKREAERWEAELTERFEKDVRFRFMVIKGLAASGPDYIERMAGDYSNLSFRANLPSFSHDDDVLVPEGDAANGALKDRARTVEEARKRVQATTGQSMRSIIRETRGWDVDQVLELIAA